MSAKRALRFAAVARRGLAPACGVNLVLRLDIAHSATRPPGSRTGALYINSHASLLQPPRVVLDPLRRSPAQSTTYGLAIAPSVAAFALSVVLAGLAWRQLRRAGDWLWALWLVLMAAIALLVVLMVMPASWWLAIGSPFTYIQFPYRLAGWLLLAVAVQLAVSLRWARDLGGHRRSLSIVFAARWSSSPSSRPRAALCGPALDHELVYDVSPRQAVSRTA